MIFPGFTHDGKYRVDVSLEYLSTMLTSFRDDYGLDMNVDFPKGARVDEWAGRRLR